MAAHPAGTWARLTADAIGVHLKRSGLTAKALYESAGMSPAMYHSRTSGRVSFTLNEVEALADALEVTPLEIAQMAAKLGELTPNRVGVPA
ncbi:helix-turn-helix domain-containing protein [Microbacterium sp. NPDC055665]